MGATDQCRFVWPLLRRLPGVGRPRADRFSRLLNRLSRSFLPDNGDSILEKGNPRVAEAIRAVVEKKQLSLPPLPASFFQVNEADRAWVDSMCTPQPLGTYTEKLVLSGAREAIAKKTYIRAKGYAQPIFDAAEEKLKKDPTWRVLPVESGHDVMVDAPDRLVEMLLEAT